MSGSVQAALLTGQSPDILISAEWWSGFYGLVTNTASSPLLYRGSGGHQSQEALRGHQMPNKRLVCVSDNQIGRSLCWAREAQQRANASALAEVTI